MCLGFGGVLKKTPDLCPVEKMLHSPGLSITMFVHNRKTPMKVTTYGTAGSLAICRMNRIVHGGNTTCLRIHSVCLQKGLVLAVDAGTGYYPMSMEVLRAGGTVKIATLFTHYHHDHTQGLLLAPPTYIKSLHMELLGPVDQNIGPKEVLESLMKPPFHPLDSVEVKSHFSFVRIEHPAGTVIVFHPEGGRKKMELDEFQRLEAKKSLIPVGEGKYPIDECLIVKMIKTTHPEHTISYRFEERPTGKVFVFLTDHENTDGVASALRDHISGADLFIADAQYDRKTYETRTAGYGHGTGEYVTRLAEHCGVSHVGLTHHDPNADDPSIEFILDEAKAARTRPETRIFSCKDMETIEV